MHNSEQSIPMRRWLPVLILLCFCIGATVTFNGGTLAKEPEPEGVALSATKISAMRLAGTVVSLDPDRSFAVIEDQQGKQQGLYHEGDRAGGVLIKSIQRDHIVVDAGNGDTRVKISGYLTRGAAPSTAAASDPSTPSTQRLGSRERYYFIDLEEAEAALSNLQDLIDTVEITPGRLFNRQTGFRISPVESDSFFAKMGLRSGDLVLALNGQEMIGPDDVPAFLETIREGGEVDLMVRRRARTYRISLEIR